MSPPIQLFSHIHSHVTHQDHLVINNRVRSPGSKPCIDMRANATMGITKILVVWGTERLAVRCCGVEHMIRVCRRDLKATSIM